MGRENGYELALSEETEEKLGEYARKTGFSVDEAFEFIITNYLQRQLPIIKKRSGETGTPVNELLDEQFVRLLDFLINKEQGNG
ncbi:MAG: hypothetical protein ACOY40_14155 [Bacillota bacterium]